MKKLKSISWWNEAFYDAAVLCSLCAILLLLAWVWLTTTLMLQCVSTAAIAAGFFRYLHWLTVDLAEDENYYKELKKIDALFDSTLGPFSTGRR